MYSYNKSKVHHSVSPSWLSWSWRSFLYSFSVYSCHLFIISSVSVRSIPFLSFIEPIFGIYDFLEEISSLSHFCCFPLFLCIDHWGRLSSLSLLFFGTLHSDGYLSFSPLLLASLLFTAICKASSDSHFAFLHFFFLGMVLLPVSCTMSWTSVHSSSGTLSDLVPWIYLSLPLYNHTGFNLGHIWRAWWFSLFSSI